MCLSALLSAYPEGARKKDRKGDLPIHRAVENNASVEVMSALLSAYTEGARKKNYDKSFLSTLLLHSLPL